MSKRELNERSKVFVYHMPCGLKLQTETTHTHHHQTGGWLATLSFHSLLKNSQNGGLVASATNNLTASSCSK